MRIINITLYCNLNDASRNPIVDKKDRINTLVVRSFNEVRWLSHSVKICHPLTCALTSQVINITEYGRR